MRQDEGGTSTDAVTPGYPSLSARRLCEPNLLDVLIASLED